MFRYSGETVRLTESLPLVVFISHEMCVACVLFSQFIMLTYVFMLAWLGVTAFTSLPVFMYFNIWNTCQNTTAIDLVNLCFDLRQFGMWWREGWILDSDWSGGAGVVTQLLMAFFCEGDWEGDYAKVFMTEELTLSGFFPSVTSQGAWTPLIAPIYCIAMVSFYGIYIYIPPVHF